MFKKQVYYCRATQTGIGIRFYYALSDPTLCTDMYSCMASGPPQNTVVENDREIKLPVFLLAMWFADGIVNTSLVCLH